MTDNTAQRRYELVEQGHTAYADYAINGDVVSIKYVYAPPELRGQGTAGRLMEEIAQTAKAQNLKLFPICGYAVSWLRRHEEYKVLLA